LLQFKKNINHTLTHYYYYIIIYMGQQVKDHCPCRMCTRPSISYYFYNLVFWPRKNTRLEAMRNSKFPEYYVTVSMDTW